MRQRVLIPSDSVGLDGELTVPKRAIGVVLFAHGSGSSRLSPRNRLVAESLQKIGIGTLLFDLLTEEEAADRENVFDIDFLAHRLIDATRWIQQEGSTRGYPLGYFGASTGAAAALTAAAGEHSIRAVVSRGGRPDLAMRHLAAVTAPTLLIVGGQDYGVIELNEQAYRVLRCAKAMKVVPGATHLFEEPGTLQQVCNLAGDWFAKYLPAPRPYHPRSEEPIVFSDRKAAGRMLAGRLASYTGPDTVVLGIARGGLPVAQEVAAAIHAPLDVIVVRKLGAPHQPELGIGAIVDGDHPHAIFNRDVIEQLGVSPEYIEAEIARQLKEVKRREQEYRGNRSPTQLEGLTVIVVDDGIATGSSVRAALQGVRRQHPRRLILATPVAPVESLEALHAEADEIVCLETPADFFAVGQFYSNFGQVGDDQVKAMLAQAQAAEHQSA